MANKSTSEKPRGKFLTIMLVFGAFGVLSSLYTLTNTSAIATAYGSVPAWFLPYTIVGLALGAAFLYGAWMWKKWAVYLYGVQFGLGLLIQLFVLKPADAGVGAYAYFLTIAGAGLMFWAIYRKWQYFEN